MLGHLGRHVRRGPALAAAAGEVGAQLVGQSTLGDRDEPAMRAVGNAVGRPLLGGGEQRLLRPVLGVGEVAVPARDRAEDPRRQLAQQVLDTGRRRHSSGSAGACITGRTSISFPTALPPGPGAAEVAAAISIARASESTSTSQ